MDWIYDIETYPNCFLFAIVSSDMKHKFVFEVSHRKNEINRVFDCIDYLSESGEMVGFNNLGFDYPVIHDILQHREEFLNMQGNKLAKLIYAFAQKQIESGNSGFPRTIPYDEVAVKQVDLYKIWHFDNKAKATSLKMIEFNMRSETIEDLPFPVGTVLTDEQIDTLIDYNMHDVMKTLDFYFVSKKMLEFRRDITQKYGRDFTNHNDTKIGKDYFLMRLAEAGIATHKYEGKVRKIIQTKRPVIKIADCLFDYYNFEREEFIAVFNWFKRQRITETKGVFSDIEEHDLGDVAKYAEMTTKKKKFQGKPSVEEEQRFKVEHPCGWIEAVELKAKKKGETQYSYWGCWRIAETLNVVVDGFRFDYGTGGIHGSISNKVARSNNDYDIVDADVSSMYPNIGISNRVYPEHLSEMFCDIYQDVYEQRKSFPKGSAENAMLKLALNGVYGDSNNKFSPFYDPQYTMKITINGQLSLTLLAEKLLAIPYLKLIQVNTDGITVALPKESRDEYNRICKEWQERVKLELEFADYSKMIIRDVNNYIAVYTNDKVKRKGAYQYEDLGWHQNQSSLVIPKAAEAYMLHGTPIEDFVKNHSDIFDFMLRTKVPRSSKLVMVMPSGVEVLQQNICRYYPCKSGGKLVKLMPPLEEGGEVRRMAIDSEWNVQTCNNIKDFKGDIDYDYFIAEAKKLVIE